MIIKQIAVGAMEVCCYIVGCPGSKEAVLIDPAGDEERVMETTKTLGFQVRCIVNTHGHPDHTCGNEKMKSLTGASVIMHELDDQLFSEPDIQTLFRQWGFEPAPPADIRIKDGDLITFGESSLEVIHTPGHTPGGICLYGKGNLFTGDTLFVGAVGRTDLPGGSLETLLRSIRERILPLPDNTIIWPGHDYGDAPSSTLKEQKQTNPYIKDLITI